MSENDLDEAQLARAREAFALVPYAKFLGLELGEMKRGEAAVQLEVRAELKQNHGVMHGGAIASLIDTASAFAVVTQLEAGEGVTTIDLSIHYLRPVTAGRLTARARTVRAGRRLFVLSIEVIDDKGRLMATAVTTYIKLQESP